MSLKKVLAGAILVTMLGTATALWQHVTERPAEPVKQSAGKALGTAPSKPKPILHSIVPSEPTKLTIPTLDIDSARIQSVGQAESGEMESPKERTAIGWYKYGYLPGSLGNSVLAGHSWHVAGRGIFADLRKLTPGDTLSLTTQTSIQTYKVVDSKTYSPDHPLTDEIFGASDKARLNLITCAGSWNKQTQRYEDRLVVFSEFVSENTTSSP